MMKSLALCWVLSLTIAALSHCPTWAAQLEGIVTNAGDGIRPAAQNAGAESTDTISCLAVVYPYSTWEPSLNSSAKQPTSSPVPPYVEGSINFRLVNTGSNPIQAPWTLGVYNPLYTQVIQVWNFDFLNATAGQVYGNASAAYETLMPSSNNSIFLGILVQALQNNIEPQNITVNGEECAIQLVNNITAVDPLATSANGSLSQTESAEQPVSIQNGVIIGVDGQPVGMKAINYFGFNNGATMFDGLYAGSNSLTQDFGLNLYRIQALGFNAIRVPFSFQTLFKSQPNSFTKSCTPISQADLRANISPPGVNIDPNLALPIQAFPEGNDPAICNQNLPNDSVYHRFLYIIQFLARNNFYILIDDHSEDPTVQSDPNTWVQYWTQLMTDICQDPKSCNRVMVDILNEPDHAGYTWAQLGPLYLAVMDSIHAVPSCANTLFWVEGTGQLGLPGTNWGDGFATDPTIIQQYGLSDPNTFFQTLMTKPYLNQVGISPHIYPPSVTYATQGYQGTALWFRMYNSFGYLNNQGYNGHLFPIFIGEVGSKFETATDIQSLNDMQAWFLAKPNTGAAHNAVPNIAYWDYNANSGDTGGIVDDSWVNVLWVKINWLIATVNLQPWYLGAGSSSSPTPVAASPPPVVASPPPLIASPPPLVASPPPLVASPPPVVASPPPRVASPPPVVASPPPLVTSPPPIVSSPPPRVASPPIVASPPPVVASPPPRVASPPPVVPSPPAVMPSPPPVPAPTPVSTKNLPVQILRPPPPKATLPPLPQARPATATVASPPPPKISSRSPPPVPTPSGGSCQAYSTMSSPWASGTGEFSDSVNIYLKNTGSSPIPVPYTVNVTAPGYTSTQYSWNWDVLSTQGHTQSGVVQISWAGLQPNGAIVNFGSVVNSATSDLMSFTPTAVVVNGINCAIVPAPSLPS